MGSKIAAIYSGGSKSSIFHHKRIQKGMDRYIAFSGADASMCGSWSGIQARLKAEEKQFERERCLDGPVAILW